MDVLSDVLDTVRLTSTVVVQTELMAPWGISTGPREHYAFHVVSRGTALFAAAGAAPVELAAGDVVVLAPGHAHTLRSDPAAPVRDVRELLAEGALCRPAGTRAGATQLVCGSFRFDDPHDAFRAVLPTVLHVRAEGGTAGPWLAQTLELLRHESFGDQPGTATVANRLCDALFVYLLRSHLTARAGDGGSASWLRGLDDPSIRAALALMHERPEHGWSVAALAANVGLSRAAFAARFAGIDGQTPIRYLTEWRMQKAAVLLRSDRRSIEAIARHVGYDSPVAFAKTFKRVTGRPPGEYRRLARPA